MIPPKRKSLNRPGSGPKNPPARPAPSSSKPSPAKPQLGPSNGARPGARPSPKPAAKATPPPAAPLRRGPAPAPSASPSRRGPMPTQRLSGKSNAKMIGAIAGVAIVAIAGILYYLKSGTIDNEVQKKELAEKLKAVAAEPDLIKQDEMLAKLLENPLYEVKYCGEVRTQQLDKMYKEVHPKAEHQRKANADVPPFFEKYKPESLDNDTAQKLLDEATHLKNDYGDTTHGDKLKDVVKALKDWLEAHASTTKWDSTEELATLRRRVYQADNDKHFNLAYKLIEDFEKKWKSESGNSEFVKAMKEERDHVAKAIKDYVSETLKGAQEMIDKGQTELAKDLLKKAMQAVEGHDEYKELEKKLKGIK